MLKLLFILPLYPDKKNRGLALLLVAVLLSVPALALAEEADEAPADVQKPDAAAEPEAPDDAAHQTDDADETDDAEPAASPGQFEQLVDDLVDADFETREQATTELMQMDVTDEQLSQALEQATVPEQAHRLRRVVMHRFYNRLDPRDATGRREPAGLGVSLDRDIQRIVSPDEFEGLDRHAAMITDRIPGFPGFVHLRPGDLLLGIDDHFIGPDMQTEDVITRIAAFNPGDEVTLHVVRDGERIEVPVTLDSGLRLNAVANGHPRGQHPSLHRPLVQHFDELGASPDRAVLKLPEPSDDAVSESSPD